MGVALLEGLDLGLDAHHLQRGLHHHEAGGQQHQVEDHGDDDDGPAPVVGARAEQIAQPAQRKVERLGDDGPHAELDQAARATGRRLCRRRPWRGWSSARPVCLGPANRRRRVSPLVSPMARPSTLSGFFWLFGLLRSLGRSTHVMQRDQGCVRGRVGQESRGKVEIGDRRVLDTAGRRWRCRSPLRRRSCPACRRATRQSAKAWAAGCGSATTGRNSSMSPRPAGHSTSARTGTPLRRTWVSMPIT